jgi:hypothetical protein
VAGEGLAALLNWLGWMAAPADFIWLCVLFRSAGKRRQHIFVYFQLVDLFCRVFLPKSICQELVQ